MKIGFTGTQLGMSERQKTGLTDLLRTLKATEFHHGDCVGADTEAGDIARGLGITVVIHPPIDIKKRAWSPYDIAYTEKRYLDRNRDIVNCSEVLIAAPKDEAQEEIRSGTWFTVRYARRLHRPLHILTR